MSRTDFSQRKKSCNTGVDADDAGPRREDSMVEIRKNKREDNLLKKPMILHESQRAPADASQAPPNLELRLENIHAIKQALWSEDLSVQVEATTQFRKLLIDRNPPIDEVIKAGVVPKFVESLGRNDLPQLQFEAAWALTRLAFGTSEHTQVIIENGAVPMLVQLLRSPSDDVRELAVWSLSNIAGDSPSCRDVVLGHGALMPLLALFKENSELYMQRLAAWTLLNLCQGNPPVPFEQVKLVLPVLRNLIHMNDDEVLTDACQALSCLSDGTNDKSQAMIEARVCPSLVGLLLHPLTTIVEPALRTVRNIVTGDDAQTQFMIDNHVLQCLYQLLTQKHIKSIMKEACWTVSNITAGNTNHIEAVIKAGIIPPLVHLLESAEFDVKREAVWAISNVAKGGSHDHIRHLVKEGCIKPLCDLLICPDPMIVKVSLEGIENILKVGEAEKEMGMNVGEGNVYAHMVGECQGWDEIDSLLAQDNKEIYEKAVKLLEKYWVDEDEELKLVDIYYMVPN